MATRAPRGCAQPSRYADPARAVHRGAAVLRSRSRPDGLVGPRSPGGPGSSARAGCPRPGSCRQTPLITRLCRCPTHPTRSRRPTVGRAPSRDCGPRGRRCLPPTQGARRRSRAGRRGGPTSAMHSVRSVRRGPRGRSTAQRTESSGAGRDGRWRPVGRRDARPGDHGCPGDSGARLERLALEDDGEFIAPPDAYWATVAAALQIDSMRWHLGPAAYKRTQRTSARSHDTWRDGAACGTGSRDRRPGRVRPRGSALLRAADARPMPHGHPRRPASSGCLSEPPRRPRACARCQCRIARCVSVPHQWPGRTVADRGQRSGRVNGRPGRRSEPGAVHHSITSTTRRPAMTDGSCSASRRASSSEPAR